MKGIFHVLMAVFILVSGCKEDKKISLEDDDTVTVSDFIEFFPDRELPVVIRDTSLSAKVSDSLRIGNKIFSQFVPDSVLTSVFGKQAKPLLFPIGKAREKGKETYLFLRAVSGKRRAAFLVCFDKDNKYLNAMPIVKSGFGNQGSAYGELDRKFQITTYREISRKGNEPTFKRNIYVYNSGVNEFTLILTEPNEEIIENVINPIDTLPAKNKLAGDYIKDSRNFVSFRDGRNDQEMRFFVHFEKDKGECIGEVKGTVRITGDKKAHYQEAGNPCALEFTFTTKGVTMKEVGGCGSYRDIKCFFDGTYPKKKPAKSTTTSKKK